MPAFLISVSAMAFKSKDYTSFLTLFWSNFKLKSCKNGTKEFLCIVQFLLYFLFSLPTHVHTYIVSEPCLNKLQTWCPLFLNTSAVLPENKGSFVHSQSINIRVRKLILIHYYHLICRLHANFVSCPNNVLCKITKTCSLSYPQSSARSRYI